MAFGFVSTRILCDIDPINEFSHGNDGGTTVFRSWKPQNAPTGKEDFRTRATAAAKSRRRRRFLARCSLPFLIKINLFKPFPLDSFTKGSIEFLRKIYKKNSKMLISFV